MDLMVQHNRAVLFVGPTGTGKTVYVKDHLMNRLEKEKFIPLIVNFSAQTSAGQVQVSRWKISKFKIFCTIKGHYNV